MGRFDVRELWSLDQDIAEDIIRVFAFLEASPNLYPDTLGYDSDFAEIIAAHRGHLSPQSRLTEMYVSSIGVCPASGRSTHLQQECLEAPKWLPTGD